MSLSTLIRSSVRTYFHRTWDLSILWKCGKVTPYTKRILKQVYLTLCFAYASSAFGSHLRFTGYFGNLFTLFGCFLSTTCLYFAPKRNQKIRVCLLIAGAFFLGALFAPLHTGSPNLTPLFFVAFQLSISMAFYFLYVTSQLDICLVLVCVGAMVLRLLYFLLTIFLDNYFQIETQPIKSLLLGLPFMVYVAAYSHEIVLKARRGDDDYVKHSIKLFTDFPAFINHLLNLIAFALAKSILIRIYDY